MLTMDTKRSGPIQTPSDPSNNFSDMINNTSGLTGITVNNKLQNKPDATDDDIGKILKASNEKVQRNEDISTTSDSSPPGSPRQKQTYTLTNESVHNENLMFMDM